MTTRCPICGVEDLMMACFSGGVCAVCTMRFFGGGQPSKELIAKARNTLGLAEGEFLKQDHGGEAAKILGRQPRNV